MPEAMWLAETAINLDTVVELIKAGIKFTILSPTQADKFRKFGDTEWTGCSNTDIDTTRPYRIYPRDKEGNLVCDGYLDVFFYNPWLSSAVGFEHLLRNADTFGNRIRDAWDANRKDPQLVSIGTDGESYGHHEPFGDMCAAWLYNHYAPDHNMVPVNYGWFLEQFPPQHEVMLKNFHGEGCAWSCAHGVGRWYRDCGCSTGGGPGWNQKWRGYVSVDVYGMNGRHTATLFNGTLAQGSYAFSLENMPKGMYIVRVKGAGITATQPALVK